MQRNGKIWKITALTLAAVMGLAGCGGGSSATDGDTIKVMYYKTDSFSQFDDLMKKVKATIEKENPGKTVELQPVTASDTDYKTKLALAQRSAETAPDVFYEDSSQIRADADAGYLLKLDDYLDKWDDWNNEFTDAAKKVGKGKDGTYAVPLSTDTRVIWYNKNVFEKAGIETPWQPESWQDILDAAATIKAKVPDAVPFNMFAGTAIAEGSVMQSFYELLFGTDLGDDALVDSSSDKWVIGSQGMKDSLEFIKTLYDKGYAPTAAQALDANLGTTIANEWLPQDKIGGTVDGSWMPSTWMEGGSYEWPDYENVIGAALFPTQNGEDPGYVSMSGGWTLAVGSKTKNAQLAFDFVKEATSKDNSLDYVKKMSLTAVRNDVAEDPGYLASTPYTEITTEAVKYTHFRPSTTEYTKVSAKIQEAMESVITGQSSVDEAAKAYDEAVTSIVGEDNIIEKK